MGELCKFLDHSASQMLDEEAGESEPPLWFGTVYILDPLFQTPPWLVCWGGHVRQSPPSLVSLPKLSQIHSDFRVGETCSFFCCL